MIEKDFFMRLIQQLSEFLAVIIGFKKKGDFASANDSIEESYKALWDITSEYINSLPKDELIKELVENKGYNDKQLTVIGYLLVEKADINFEQDNKSQSKLYYEKALTILEFINYINKDVYSLERIGKINWVKRQLKNV